MIRSFLSLRKTKRSFRHLHRYYQKKREKIDETKRPFIEETLQILRQTILRKEADVAREQVRQLSEILYSQAPKNRWDRLKEQGMGILFALLIAVLIRTTWFELYTIPTGSMRPTLKEEDYLIVSKTDYGINVPLQEKHFYFDSDLIQRGSIVVFNGANMDIADADTVYFYLFPGKKQFVKRLIGKPGDTLFFYGGQIYGIDRNRKPLEDLKEINEIEHIPFIRFDGKVDTHPSPAKGGLFPSVMFYQMNQPVAKLNLLSMGKIQGEMLSQNGRPPLKNYSDLWGMKNYAMARLLTPAEKDKLHPHVSLEKGVLYLELTHHPSLDSSQLVRDEYQRLRPDLSLHVSLLPLQQEHLDKLAQHMTTCRFSVQDGVAWRHGWNPKELSTYLPRFPQVRDGMYEIVDGKVYDLPFPKIPFIGIFTNGYTRLLNSDHPLASSSPEMVHKLFNLGIELLDPYLPTSSSQKAIPSRYAYFRDGHLYLLGAPIFSKEDPLLQSFIEREKEREKMATSYHPYHPFLDSKVPTLEEIEQQGIRVPEHMYLVLGDNHAMSADSRQFGFVPEENLKGGVSFLFSPPGSRWGRPPQPSIPHFTVPNIAIWTSFLLACYFSSLYYRRKFHKPLKF